MTEAERTAVMLDRMAGDLANSLEWAIGHISYSGPEVNPERFIAARAVLKSRRLFERAVNEGYNPSMAHDNRMDHAAAMIAVRNPSWCRVDPAQLSDLAQAATQATAAAAYQDTLPQPAEVVIAHQTPAEGFKFDNETALLHKIVDELREIKALLKAAP